MNTFFVWFIIALSSVLATATSLKLMHYLQLSGYKVSNFWSYLITTKFEFFRRFFALAFLSTVSMLVFVACFGAYEYYNLLGYLFFALLSSLFVYLTLKQPAKVAFRLTFRVVRLIVVTLFLNFALACVVAKLSFNTMFLYAFIGVLPIFSIPLVSLASYIIYPIELLNQRAFVRMAKAKLAENPQLIVVGITGSYGKTTAKNILATMLSSRYKVCVSPLNYNTPMGLCKAINDGVTTDKEVFIAEMGARRVGEIKELCDIVRPKYGVITCIGNQHLETFKTLENIAKTKFELGENLPSDGAIVLSANDEMSMANRERVSCRILLAGLDEKVADCSYSAVEISATGTQFILSLDDTQYTVQTTMLGEHIPSLIAECAVLSRCMGVRSDEIIESINKLKPIPHRLQLIPSGENVIIDDAYNANIVGTASALKVLEKFDNFVKIVITPGLIELGADEKKCNEILGENIGKVADKLYAIGSRGASIMAGAKRNNMDEKDIILCGSVDEAVEKARQVAGKKAMLFMSDLPDNVL